MVTFGPLVRPSSFFKFGPLVFIYSADRILPYGPDSFSPNALIQMIMLPILSLISNVNTQKLAAYYLQVMYFFKKDEVVFGVQLLVIILQNDPA